MKSSKQPSKQEQALKTELEEAKSASKLNVINFILIGIVLGFLVFAVLRFFTYQPPKHTHYHANWNVWVNDQQETFNDPSFYQEVASCSVHDEADIKHRAHLHDEVYDVVHVHAEGVTWGQFMENINSAAQPGYLRIHNSIYENSDGNKVTYVLNGKQLDSLNGLIIGDQDKLLINYGNDTPEVIQQRYESIQNKAKTADETKDPAACQGDEGNSLGDRFKAILF